ncbi:MAG: serine O-acetyltransferase [Herpetosiphonaceae bacterium]|nr:serine O-acetyltransferase [Herpetosiphonaceae bacterium]
MQTILRNDPAARSRAEVLLYPGFHAVVIHRLSHALWVRDMPFLPRLISQFTRWITGIEIHPGATLGRRLFIDHGMGVVIGETAIIGDDVVMYQGVTLGGTGKERGKRHPTIGNHVVVGVGAKVLGAITIGDGARIGGGAVVLKNVPPHSTAIGVPARVVATRDPTTGTMQRVENLPDPEGAMLRALHGTVQQLEQRILELESGLGSHAYHIAALSAAQNVDDPFECLDDPQEQEWSPGWGI